MNCDFVGYSYWNAVLSVYTCCNQNLDSFGVTKFPTVFQSSSIFESLIIKLF